MNTSLLMIFVKNPVSGHVKTRLGAVTGAEKALSVYNELLHITMKASSELKTDKLVFYSDQIDSDDLWKPGIFQKELQCGNDLGQRMNNAFKHAFERGYREVILIGSDIPEISTQLLRTAFEKIKTYNVVIGPSTDGGYYLLGTKEYRPELFMKKKWSTPEVLTDTLKDLENDNVFLLEPLHDIDTYDDLKRYPDLKKLTE